jgi:acyl-CoA synthetase (NDP forming)
MLVTFSQLAPPQGRRAVICGSNGGFSVLTADDYIQAGFELPQLAPKEQQKIYEQVARFSSTDAGMILRNPFDITNVPSPEGQYAIMSSLATNDRFDMTVGQVSISNSAWPFAQSPYIYWPDMFLNSLLKVQREVGKPVAAILHSISTAGEFERMARLRDKCQAAGVPVYDSIPRAALAMDRFMRYHEKR